MYVRVWSNQCIRFDHKLAYVLEHNNINKHIVLKTTEDNTTIACSGVAISSLTKAGSFLINLFNGNSYTFSR